MKEFIESEVIPTATGDLLIQGTFRKFAFPRHMHEGYSIGMVHSGVNRFECGGNSWAAPAGSVCVMNPEQIHSGEADDEGWTYTNLFLKPDALLGALGKPSGADPIVFKQHVFEDPFVNARFKGLVDASLAGAEPMAAECEYSLLLVRLGQIATGVAGEKKATGRAILRVRDMLDSVCDRSINLAELAQVGEVNTFHLVRSFTDEFGISPYAYHMNRRLQRAQRMIEAGTLVADAAYATGFTDQAHFTRHFRRFLGITPGRVAKYFKQRR
jgi:AraC-like DNA-binding protein